VLLAEGGRNHEAGETIVGGGGELGVGLVGGLL
jgi:hypothetical protein